LYVAPVVTASISSRTVILPSGSWYDFETGEAIDGGQTIERNAPLGELLIFARAGAIVPMLPEGVESLVPSGDVRDLDDVRFERTVIVFLGGSGSFKEAGGGEYVLANAAHPPGSGRMTLTASGDAVTCPFDQICIETKGFDPKYTFAFDVRW
jgi:hypothetical protein